MNEKRVFSDPKVLRKLEELNVELIKADKTNANPEIDADLKRFGRSNIPVNIVVPADPDAPLIMLPEVIGPDDAIRALEQAAGNRV